MNKEIKDDIEYLKEMIKIETIFCYDNKDNAIETAELIHNELDRLIEKINNSFTELKKDIIKNKDNIQKETGSFKYDWCFDLFIELIKKYENTNS